MAHQVQITASGRASYRNATFADLTEPDEAGFSDRSPNRQMEASDEFIARREDARMEVHRGHLLKTNGFKYHSIKLEHAYAGRDLTDPGTSYIPCLPGCTSEKFINRENLNLSWWKTVNDAYYWWQENDFCSIAGYASSYHAFEQVAPIAKRRKDPAALVGEKRRKLMDASEEIAMVASPTQRSIEETIMAILSALGQHTAEVLSSSLVRQANVAVTEVFGADSDLMNVTLREKVSRLCNELGIPAYEP